ncbi:DNA mismatch repair protein MutS [Pseudochelatococcus lubricantis]|uniref:DNA mismatch repair protein MutS n=1 Tax=Pseudochelatococcus lubricantis TaxID=1538102 RepID=A0ABX0UZ13_9HYPH|nr:DNA mismatch repair protein MutS [Pseudochelatococcus lubricantis]NIJ58171.1 DNA mismatch repair protein MutS [Pseudochelatococcus lubricantis]
MIRLSAAPSPVPPVDDASARPNAAEKPSPMMQQYIEIKVAHPDTLLFYRMGDFYELFFADAEVASRTLGIVLTKRGKHLGEDIPMCGVPVDKAEDYLERLIAAGHRVAVCEQTEDPAEARKRGGKSVVRRAVVRLVTPGTITEDRLLEPGRANWLAAVARRRLSEREWAYAVAAADISTGRFTVSEVAGIALMAEIARLEPREIILPDAIHDDEGLRAFWQEQRAAVTPVAHEGFDSASAARRLREYFGVAELAGFGQFSPAELSACAAVVAYVERTQLGSRPPLSPPAHEAEGSGLAIDAATRANLELTRTLSGERAGSLLAAIDRTLTPGGGRLLAERLGGPLTDPPAIAARQDAVQALVDDIVLRERLRARLRAAPDMARALSRLMLGRGGPRDLATVRDGLAAARAVAGDMASGAVSAGLPAELDAARRDLDALDPAWGEALAAALADDLPLLKRDGGFVRAGHDAGLDEARLLQADSRKVIAALQARYAGESGCRQLKVKHNNLIGYFVEVPQAAGEAFVRPPLNETFSHRQTMAGTMRFSTVELGELESRIASAGGRALAIEHAVFDRLAGALADHAETIKRAADALAVVDVTAALADLAVDLGWTRPHVDASLDFAVEGGRHPVVEAACRRNGVAFVANDCDLSPPGAAKWGRITLITGPNMAGKSTFLRQSALIVVLAQMGAFVPAKAARVGVVDRLFSRVGAADDLARGRSTFMVEMIETAAILNQAGERSLVILDEIGRGTATFDGLSIAWAAIEHLHEANRCRALFATHYHELTALADRLKRVSNATVRVTEWQGEVVFLHEVVPGAADRSYGIQVAKLAGLPAKVIHRARAILSELEKSEREKPVSALIDDLPLFAAFNAPRAAATEVRADPLREALDTIVPDELSPREALEALYRLKGLRLDEAGEKIN